MHDYQNPWRWAAALSIAITLLWAVVFVVPSPWFAFLFDINQKRAQEFMESPSPWLILHPPLELLVENEQKIITPDEPLEPQTEPFEPQDWWNQSVGISVVAREPANGPRISSQDSVRYFLNRLGLSDDFMIRTQPDSVLAAKIFFLQLEESFDFSDAKSYLSAVGRAKDYEDIMSRAAAMYDEFLQTNIMVPD